MLHNAQIDIFNLTEKFKSFRHTMSNLFKNYTIKTETSFRYLKPLDKNISHNMFVEKQLKIKKFCSFSKTCDMFISIAKPMGVVRKEQRR